MISSAEVVDGAPVAVGLDDLQPELAAALAPGFAGDGVDGTDAWRPDLHPDGPDDAEEEQPDEDDDDDLEGPEEVLIVERGGDEMVRTRPQDVSNLRVVVPTVMSSPSSQDLLA